MSGVVGIDLSTFAIELMKLDETTDEATWTHIPLEGGAIAWDRTLRIRDAMPPAAYWQDVYLVAIEEPYGRGQAGTVAVLNRVVGAISAVLPPQLRKPERCWIVAPHEWKNSLGLRAKPALDDLYRLTPGMQIHHPNGVFVDQNAFDAYAIALFARTANAKGVAA